MLTTVSIMFVDVRGFTAISERIMPDEAVSRLNPFYSLAAREVFELDGTLDKMVGDQVMAFSGLLLTRMITRRGRSRWL